MLEWLLGKGLKTREIEKAVEKILQEYDHYIVHYQKPPKPKQEFERRYRLAQLKMMDMTYFLSEEIKILKSLISRAEEESRQQLLAEMNPRPKNTKPKSYADRVIEKLQKAIEPYPSRGIHPEANYDVDKLYGALEWLATSIWPQMVPHLRTIASDKTRERDLELNQLIPGGGRLGREEEAYKALLTEPAPLNRIAQKQKELILRASFWLHRTRGLIYSGTTSNDPRVKEVCDKALAFWDRIIVDFRLKDLKPPKED